MENKDPDHKPRSPRSRLWLGVLILALLFYTSSLVYQACTPTRMNRYQAWATSVVEVGETPPQTLPIAIAYPTVVPTEASDKPGRPISVWLWYATPGSAFAPTTPVTYTVAFTPFNKGLLFTDEEGVPVAPEVEVVPKGWPGTPGVVYVRREPSASPLPTAIDLGVWVRGPSTARISLSPPLTLTIGIESTWSAGFRHFLDLALGPTTPLLALAAALVGVGLQWWREEQRRRLEEEQEAQRKHQERLRKIEGLRGLAAQRPGEAAKRWWDYRKKVDSDPEWGYPDLAACLNDVWKVIAIQPWRLALLHEAAEHLAQNNPDQVRETARLIMALDPGNLVAQDFDRAGQLMAARRGQGGTWPDQVDELGPQTAVSALIRVGTEFAETCGEPIIQMLADLLGRSEYVQVVEACLVRDPDGRRLLREPLFNEALQNLQRSPDETVRQAATRLLNTRQEPFQWPLLWPKARPVEPRAIASWLKPAGLQHNPFGPEFAELDPLLPDHRADLPTLTQMRGARPTLVLGASGAGKTAAALLLAYDCTDPPASPRESGAFPVYWALSWERTLQASRRSQLDAVARAFSRAILHFVALNPYAFLERPAAGRGAIAELLTRYAGSTANLTLRLRQAGLGAEGAGARLLREMTELGSKVTLDADLDEATLLELLGNARPAEFTHTYVLADLRTHPGDEAESQEMAQWLRPLLDLAVPLARADTYLKAFVPDSIQSHLGDLSAFTITTLKWDPAHLANLLKQRLLKAGVPSLTQLCETEAQTPDPSARLVEAAAGSPRKLIHLGNRLIEKQATEEPSKAKLSARVLNAVLRRV